MANYDNTNRFKVWKNEKKKDNDPDFSIDININGVDTQVTIWKRKEGANPRAPLYSGTIQSKGDSPRSTATASPAKEEPPPFNDDIGF